MYLEVYFVIFGEIVGLFKLSLVILFGLIIEMGNLELFFF